MNFLLAKQLKDAGFPFKFGDEVYAENGSTFLYYPTLGELIEACTGIEFIIHHYAKGHNNDITNEDWFVIERKGLMDMNRCSTSTEAVARLWLSLNEKTR